MPVEPALHHGLLVAAEPRRSAAVKSAPEAGDRAERVDQRDAVQRPPSPRRRIRTEALPELGERVGERRVEQVVVEPSGRIAQQRRQDLALEDLTVRRGSGGTAPRPAAAPALRRAMCRDHTLNTPGGDGRRGHVAVPAREQCDRVALVVGPSVRARAATGAPSRAGSDTRVRLDPRHRGDVVRGDILQSLHDATRAVRAVEIVADQVRVGVVVDPVVRRDQVAERGVDRPRQLVERDPSVPLVIVGPSGHRTRAVAGASDGIQARALVADRAVDVGVHEVLARTLHAPDGAAEPVEARRVRGVEDERRPDAALQARPSQRVRVGLGRAGCTRCACRRRRRSR